ncbi:MAG: transposase [Candidatus Faecousia sp.]|nr:transposase [Candidatus Faecousia sp.]
MHGALLRMNRSIQSEGTYGEIKANRGCERFRRRGINKAILEIPLISCGFNLRKYHLSRLVKDKQSKAAG